MVKLMNTTTKQIDNEEGFVLVAALMMMSLIMVLGIAITSTASIESKAARAGWDAKQDFVITEMGGVETSADVNENKDGNYSVTDLNQTGPLYPKPDATGEQDWDKIGEATSNSYAAKISYNGQGDRPKGYGTDFAAYVFDVTTQKAANQGIAISQGYSKIGPATN